MTRRQISTKYYKIITEILQKCNIKNVDKLLTTFQKRCILIVDKGKEESDWHWNMSHRTRAVQ